MFLKCFTLFAVFVAMLGTCGGSDELKELTTISSQQDDFLLPVKAIISKDDGNNANDLPPLDPSKLPPDVHIPPEWQFPPGDDVVTLFPQWAPPERVSHAPCRHHWGIKGCLLSRRPSSAPHHAEFNLVVNTECHGLDCTSPHSSDTSDRKLLNTPSVAATKYVPFGVVDLEEVEEEMVGFPTSDDIGDALDHHRTRSPKSDTAENNRPTPVLKNIPVPRSLTSSLDMEYAALEEQQVGRNPPPEDEPFYLPSAQEESVPVLREVSKKHQKYHLKGSGRGRNGLGGPPMHPHGVMSGGLNKKKYPKENGHGGSRLTQLLNKLND